MVSDEELRNEIRHRIESFAREGGYSLAPFLDAVLNDFVRMYRLQGDFYCPCQVENNPDTVCVCTAVRQGLVDIEGACFCGIMMSAREDES
ncbi:MAG: hypothetical protein HYX99_01695 [Chloroflexi bacterium]|nr:hypothetical protein [Chloroflexota bacterium]